MEIKEIDGKSTTLSDYESSRDEPIGDKDESSEDCLLYGVNDIPGLPQTLLLAFQQSMLCISSLLIFPFIISEIACAGKDTVPLRVSLIAATFVACGIATFIQSTFGLRLAVLHGTSLAFLPPLLAFGALPENKCTVGLDEYVERHVWEERVQTISGSLLVACLSFILFGVTGAVGVFARHVGPITIVPILTLLALSTVNTIEAKISLHWIAVFELLLLILLTIFLEGIAVPIPFYSFKHRKMVIKRAKIFSLFPYLFAISLSWLLCFLLTSLDVLPEGSPARTDSNSTVSVLASSPWLQVPYPNQFGFPRISIGLCMGYVASCLSSVIENIGSYKMAGRVSEQTNPPRTTVNRAIIVEGLGSILSASLGVGTGVTTYAESIALLHITKVASRITIQLAGIFCVFLGLFTKIAALLASLPEPLVGGILCLGMSMIAGVALSNLMCVNLSKTRNLGIIGLSMMIGMIVPKHFSKVPVKTNNETFDQVINMLLSIQMLVGGVTAFLLDNLAGGATRKDRGFSEDSDDEVPSDGYKLPEWCERCLSAFPLLRKLPFSPEETRMKVDYKL